MCLKHGKKVEAFCEDDKIVMCINCILNDDHKTHNFLNIETAYQKCIDECTNSMKKINERKSSLHDNKIIISMTLGKLNKDKETVIKEATFLFDEIISKMKSRKKHVTDSLNKDFEFLCGENEKRLNQLNEAINSIDTTTSVYHSLKGVSNVEFLKWHTKKSNPINKMLQL
jgi:predicted RNase H-like nuclease (RuvC/YqgF family)